MCKQDVKLILAGWLVGWFEYIYVYIYERETIVNCNAVWNSITLCQHHFCKKKSYHKYHLEHLAEFLKSNFSFEFRNWKVLWCDLITSIWEGQIRMTIFIANNLMWKTNGIKWTEWNV